MAKISETPIAPEYFSFNKELQWLLVIVCPNPYLSAQRCRTFLTFRHQSQISGSSISSYHVKHYDNTLYDDMISQPFVLTIRSCGKRTPFPNMKQTILLLHRLRVNSVSLLREKFFVFNFWSITESSKKILQKKRFQQLQHYLIEGGGAV